MEIEIELMKSINVDCVEVLRAAINNVCCIELIQQTWLHLLCINLDIQMISDTAYGCVQLINSSTTCI